MGVAAVLCMFTGGVYYASMNKLRQVHEVVRAEWRAWKLAILEVKIFFPSRTGVGADG